jgi:hypothetical protein
MFGGAAWAQDRGPDEAPPSAGSAAPAEQDGAPSADGDADAKSDEQRISDLEATVDVLASELSKAIADETVPEEKLESVWGFGPAASKVYRKDHGLSIGGYGEYRIRTFVGDGSDGLATEADALRAVLYVGYKFSEKWIFNSELELEHGSTEANGAFSLEFATLDWRAFENHGARAGMVLIPMGFINEIHEPTFFYGNARPEVERQIIPSTWREVGGGIFGQFADGRISYRMYGVNGFDATGFSVSGLRGGRQKGSEALANQWAFVGRTDVDVIDGLSLGGSVYVGPSGQKQTLDDDDDVNTPEVPVPDTLTTIYELHAEYKAYGVSLRGLFTQAFLKDTGALNRVLGNTNTAGDMIASRMLGAYGEIGYDVMPLVWKSTKASVEPFFRYERLDTQNGMSPSDARNANYVRDIYTAGIQVKPIPNVVFKVDYRNIKPKAGVVANQVEIGAGYVF